MLAIPVDILQAIQKKEEHEMKKRQTIEYSRYSKK